MFLIGKMQVPRGTNTEMWTNIEIASVRLRVLLASEGSRLPTEIYPSSNSTLASLGCKENLGAKKTIVTNIAIQAQTKHIGSPEERGKYSDSKTLDRVDF